MSADLYFDVPLEVELLCHNLAREHRLELEVVSTAVYVLHTRFGFELSAAALESELNTYCESQKAPVGALLS